MVERVSLSFKLRDDDGRVAVVPQDAIMHSRLTWWARRLKNGDTIAMLKSTRVQFFRTGEIGLCEIDSRTIDAISEIVSMAEDALNAPLRLADLKIPADSEFAPERKWPRHPK